MATVLENLKTILSNIFDINKTLVENQIKYVSTSDVDITLVSKSYFKNESPITTLNLTINTDSNNSCLLFTTGDTFDWTFSIDPSFKINKQFNFEPNKTYLISVDNYAILWSELYSYVPKHLELVSLGILSKPISEFTNDDIGTIVSIPYTDASGKILLNNGRIDFEVVGVNHHKDVNDESKPTITLMTKNIIHNLAFDAKEPNNPLDDVLWGQWNDNEKARAQCGNNRWSVSNIRQWLNSEGAANEWFIPQHEYDTAPDTTNVYYSAEYDYAGTYEDSPGFLVGFSDKVKQHFAIVKNKTILNRYDKDILLKDYEETEDRVFLPSYTEMGFGNIDDNNPEGSHLAQKFIDDESKIKSGGIGTASSCYWMRTGDDEITCNVISVYPGFENSYGYHNAYWAIGIAPLIVLC